MRPMHIYLVSTTEASFNPTVCKGVQCPISPFTPRWPRDKLPFHQGIHWCLTFDEISSPEMDSNDEEEDFSIAVLDDLVWSEEPIPNNHQYLFIHQIPCHTPRPATPPPQPIQEEVPQSLTSLMSLKNIYLTLTLGDTVHINTNGNMTFKSSQWRLLTDITGKQ